MSRKPRTLAEQLADAGEKVRTATAERDAAVAEAVAGGMSQREVARAIGLSHTAVQVILRRTASAAA